MSTQTYFYTEALKAPTCSDCDNECPDVKNKIKCWMYAPTRGMCPFLREVKSEVVSEEGGGK